MRRDLDHGYEEEPGPRLQGGTWTTATSRDFDHCNEECDLDHGYKERPGPRLQGGTWTTATRSDLDHEQRFRPLQ
ncbi:hypothetical protein RRG08_044976 [Elysia crispata]|uniref:Uncharacterized protein n=1 Tax=Elysia crispata TaxID=231223 RepID=A0AAE0ZY94_9GAST|nr:hypothetical protein RRG08_044976 [Elysia crispata]